MKFEKSFWVISALYLESLNNRRSQHLVTKREIEWGYLLFSLLLFLVEHTRSFCDATDPILRLKNRCYSFQVRLKTHYDNLKCNSNIIHIAIQFFLFGHTVQHAVLQFPHQGWNPCPLQWKHGVLTPGLPGKSLQYKILKEQAFIEDLRTKHCSLYSVYVLSYINFKTPRTPLCGRFQYSLHFAEKGTLVHQIQRNKNRLKQILHTCSMPSILLCSGDFVW